MMMMMMMMKLSYCSTHQECNEFNRETITVAQQKTSHSVTAKWKWRAVCVLQKKE